MRSRKSAARPPLARRRALQLANFMRTLALPKEVEHWSPTTLREKLVKIGARVVSHGRYGTSQMAEVAVAGDLFRKILRLIDDLRPRTGPSLTAEWVVAGRTRGEVCQDVETTTEIGTKWVAQTKNLVSSRC